MKEKWNFLTPSPEADLDGWNWELDIEAAKFCLNIDPKLEKMRFLLVPYKVKEEIFWKNYFSRIYIIKKTILDPNIKFTHNNQSLQSTNSNEKIIQKELPTDSKTTSIVNDKYDVPITPFPNSLPAENNNNNLKSSNSNLNITVNNSSNNVEVATVVENAKISKESKDKFEQELIQELKDIEDEIDLELGGFDVSDIDISGLFSL